MNKKRNLENEILDQEFDDISNADIEEALESLVKKGFVKREMFESGEYYYSLTEVGKRFTDENIIIED